MTYKGFDAYTKENAINVQLPETILNAENFVDYIISAKDKYINYPIYCDNCELNVYVADRIKEGVDFSDAIKLLKDDVRYDLNDLLIATRGMIEGKTATDDNIESVLNMCKVLSNGPLRLNVNLAYLDSLSHDGAVLYDLQLLRALEGKEISGEKESYYANLAELAYSYTDSYGIWKKTLTSSTMVMKNVMACLIKNNQHLGDLNEIEDVLTEMSNIRTLTNVEHGLLIRFVNDLGKSGLNDVEKKVVLSNVFGNEVWCKALIEEDSPFSKAILEKFYHDFNEQSLSAFMTSNNAWVTLNNNYWLRVLKILIDTDEFKQACSEKLLEITTHIIEGIFTGHITESNENLDLQSKILSWAEFNKVSSKVIDMMGKLGGQLTINAFKFKSLHHYMEKTRGYETQYLNYVLKPIIGNHEVQGIIYDNKVFYEPLLHTNLDQASDLKKELIKLFDNSTHEGFKTMIKGLKILPKTETIDSVDVAS
jgi:hypothetical protein